MAPRLPLQAYVDGIRSGDRVVLARAITLVESTRQEDNQLAQDVLHHVLPDTGKSIRVGLTGPPGVGKSTTLDALGMHLINLGHRVAVLAVDPSSQLGGGSILGDKTRMQRLCVEDKAYIRPSPAGQSLGGVAARTREAMLLCEAAGYDVVIIETVGVGQSEVMVSQLVDCFVALMLPGAGDELQGIKKGILEVADIITINKADGDNLLQAKQAQTQHQNALHYLRPRYSGWSVPVTLMSALSEDGVSELWDAILSFHQFLKKGEHLQEIRAIQRQQWMWSQIHDGLIQDFRSHPNVKRALSHTESLVRSGQLSPTLATKQLLALIRDSKVSDE